MSGPVFILWFFFLPETSADAILLQRAQRPAKLYNKSNIRSVSEIKRRGITPRAIFLDAIIKPFQIMLLDPAVMFTNVYMALVYGVYYSSFEAFPLVYGPIYGFNLGQQGVIFVTIVVGVCVITSTYFAVYYFIIIPDVTKNGLKSQEEVLKPALLMTFGPPIGPFLFGTSSASL
jgi:DHA1 family multidrug resistance protein-like MFS transporter